MLLSLGYLGPAGSHSSEAAEALLRELSHGFNAPLQLAPYPSLGQLIAALKHKELEAVLVPVENALEGSVREVLDALAFDFDQPIIQLEWERSIRHCLIRKTTGLDGIQVVSSHPQALAQSRQGLNQLLGEGWQAEPALSTAQAVLNLLDREDSVAAIGTKSIALAHNLQIVSDDICQNPNNHTWFLLLSQNNNLLKLNSGHYKTKTSFCVEPAQNQSGTLVAILSVFSKNGLKMTRIESRPAKTQLGEYLFYIDVEGSVTEGFIEQLKAVSNQVYFLGTYPCLTSL